MKRNGMVIITALLAVAIAIGIFIESGKSLKLVDCSWYVKDDIVVFEGKLKNNSNKPVSDFKVEITYCDSINGNILASDSLSIALGETPLLPEHMTSFGKVTFNAPVSEIKWAKYRIVDYQQGFQ